MNGIKQMLIPILKKNRKLFIAMLLIGAIGISLVVGLMGSYLSLENQLYTYLEDYNYPDISYEFAPLKKEDMNLDEIKEIEGVSDAYLRLKSDCGVTYEDTLLTGRIFTYAENDFIKQRIIEETEKSTTEYNIAIDSKFAKNNHITLGSTLTLNILGYQFVGYVNAIVTNPDCIVVRQNKYLSSQSTTFGYIYVRYDDLSDYYLDEYANELLVLTKDGENRESISNVILNTLNQTPTSVTLFEDSTVVTNIQDNLDPLRSLSSFVPFLFFFISLCVNVLFTYQIVMSYKKEMGILLTLGYSKKHIYFVFAMLSLFIGVLACIVGLLIGFAIMVIAYKAYMPHFVLESIMPSLPIGLYLLSSGLLLILFLGASLVSTCLILEKLTPLEAINQKDDQNTFSIKIKRVSIRLKMEFNRFLRAYKHNIISIFCIAVSFAIIYTAFVFWNCKLVVMEDIGEKRYQANAMVYMQDGTVTSLENNFLAIEGTQDVEVLLVASLEIKTQDGNTESVLFNALLEDYSLTNVLGENHEIIDMPRNGIVLESHTAKRLGVTVGDTITVAGKTTKVGALSSQDIMRISYATYDDLVYFTSNYTYLVLVKTTNIKALQDYLLTNTNFLAVTYYDQLMSNIRTEFETAGIGMWILTIMGLLLSIITILNMKEIAFKKEKRTIAVKKTIGYSTFDVSKELVFEDILRLILGTGIGSFLGRTLAKYAVTLLDTYSFSYPYTDNILVYLFAFFIIVFVMFVCHLKITRDIKLLPLPELIKDKE